jgi:hypothetical protein
MAYFEQGLGKLQNKNQPAVAFPHGMTKMGWEPARVKGHAMKHRCSWTIVLATIAALSTLVFCLTETSEAAGDGWTTLFNGKNLDGWDTWLGKPYQPGGKGAAEIIGLNKDPRNIFTVVEVNGTPAIRISGEVYGGLISKEEFENYHLKLEFKWGEKKWPPASKSLRNSGVLYRSVGPFGAHDTFWMRSLEFQILEGSVGDYWPIAKTIVDVEAERQGKSIVFKKGGERITSPTEDKISRIIKNPDNERPTGQWNTIELICFGPTSMHVVNGKVNLILSNPRYMADDKEVPLGKGKLQLQSEGAEIFFREIKVKGITRIPEEYSR